jgi:hypothetical protein
MRYLIFIFTIISIDSAFADIYKWKDKSGRYRFGDKAPLNVKAELIKTEESNIADFEEVPTADSGESKIISWEPTKETEVDVYFSVKYFYDGKFGDDNMWIFAETLLDGSSTSYFGVMPAKVTRGENIAVIRVGVASAAPRKHCTNGIRFSMYGKGIPTFNEATVKYNKCWLNTDIKPVESKPTKGNQ